MDNEVMVVRIYLRETEHGKHKTLMQEALNILHDQQRVQDVVVFRGIAGLGESGQVSAHLPLISEWQGVAERGY